MKVNNSKSIESRVQDLRFLIALAERGKSRVLGVQDQDIFKIAVIGDSFVYGVGVKVNERFPVILEKMLNKICPAEVFILGHPGDNIIDNYAKFLIAKKNLDIDLYIITILDNDLLFDFHDRYPNEHQIYEELKKICPQEEFIYAYPDGFNTTWKDMVVEAYYPSFSDQYANICFLEKIVEKIIRDDVMFYTYSKIPDVSLIADDSQEHSVKNLYVKNKFVSVIEKSGGRVIDPSNIDNFEQGFVSKKETHPSKKNHQQYAESLFKEITENPQYGFGKNE